jgi:hypothetical protein
MDFLRIHVRHSGWVHVICDHSQRCDYFGSAWIYTLIQLNLINLFIIYLRVYSIAQEPG